MAVKELRVCDNCERAIPSKAGKKDPAPIVLIWVTNNPDVEEEGSRPMEYCSAACARKGLQAVKEEGVIL